MRRSIGARIVTWASTAVLSVVILLPLYWIVLSSILPRELIFQFPIQYIPKQPTFNNYVMLFKSLNMPKLFTNTVITTVLGVSFGVLFSVMGGYAFSRIKFRGSNLVMGLLMLSTILPATAVLVPLFQLFRSLRIIDNVWGLTLLYINGPIPFGTWVMYGFFNQIPVSLEESAEMEGAGFVRTMFSIIAPVLKPAIATLVICDFVGAFNEFMVPLIFAANKATTLPVGFVELSASSMFATPWDTMSALGTLLLVPFVIIVIAFENRITQGLVAGSIKG